MNNFIFGNGSKSKLAGVKSIMVDLCLKALRESKYDFSITDGLRTAQQQNEIFKNKHSDCDGYQVLSIHQSGLAVDILPYVKDEDGVLINCYDYENIQVKVIYQEVHRAFLRSARKMGLNLELGITYNFGDEHDYPHIQINK